MKLEPIIVSLLDTDLYKFNMDQVIFHKHTDLCGQYYFKCRNKDIVFTSEMEDEINAQIDHLQPALHQKGARLSALHPLYQGGLCGIPAPVAPDP